MKRELICILCPRGCSLTAEMAENVVTVTGNACPNGAKYAESELLHPVRTVTATVRVANRKDTMVSVKTARPVARESMMDIMTALRRVSINAPVAIGDRVLIEGYEIVTTKAVL